MQGASREIRGAVPIITSHLLWGKWSGPASGLSKNPFPQTASSMASVVTSLQEGFEFGQAVGIGTI